MGSGAGGGTVAARLATYGHSVLLIDAGDDQGAALQQQVPAFALASTEYDPMRWDYFVQHYDDAARQQKDSKMTWQTPSGDLHVGANPPSGSTPLGILYPRAGTLGGCTTHNALVTLYPHNSDWTNIAALTGDQSWSADNMRQFFQRLERNEYLPSGTAGHGFAGWLSTGLTSLGLILKDQKIVSWVIAAAAAMGDKLTMSGIPTALGRDINSADPGRDSEVGLFQFPMPVAGPKRNGARDFIVATQNAVNADGTKKYRLDVQLNTLVSRVRFSIETGDTPKAIGVDFLSGPSLYRADRRAITTTDSGTVGSVYARREVILAAGAFNTPQLLKLSGVGPAAELASHNIPLVHDLLGVGNNLQDRYETTLVGQAPTPFTTYQNCTFLQKTPDPCLTQWQQNSQDPGPYASNGIPFGVVKKSTTADSDPDIFISGLAALFTGYFPGDSIPPPGNFSYWSWVVLKAHNHNNAGKVTLRSNNPRDTPIINFHSFDNGVTANGADTRDLQALTEGMLYARQALQDLVPLDGAFTETWPGPNVTTTEQMSEFVKQEAWGHHASCTCPIGADGDPMAVLDSKFRVRGVRGLRVVDASVFPRIPGSYLVVPTYMIGEKAADTIHADTIYTGTIRRDTIRTDTKPADTIHTDTIHADTIHAKTIHADTIHADTIHTDAGKSA